mmetsp:Transcript_17703/g.36667  ORF Transcript_17703/g.36667 Transcript_17703/m.36667 type:complete len:96 (-) Transcript_17703:144-431(-)|eukprot:CAMPEP_0172439104 /NCGR_PEP_ID=MMETSP1065-20121228/184_1 /TAXON_ID=265537 /ORGANISM="Amphiprora paludosa, Strain CCMP125" /LENGTH=95 /DNA_ID=CAMNT_0013187733 /DNA_START=79 /DNA_END=366 /DNA_ORIENTATION=-
MQIFVGDTAYSVDAGVSVDSLKAMIENKEFIPADQIRLMNNGKVLEFGSLEGNGVEEEDELALAMEVQAGMRKKWKKKRMRRLRRKRRKMRQRAR